jgi:transcriptional antiterminator NusG
VEFGKVDMAATEKPEEKVPSEEQEQPVSETEELAASVEDAAEPMGEAASDEGMAEADEDEDSAWFVIHCYSGYENTVRHPWSSALSRWE